jgi:hypothetical protein
MIAIKIYIEYVLLYRSILSSQRKNHSCAHLMLVTQLGSGYNTDLIFSRIFVAVVSETVRDNTLQTWRLIALYRFSSAKITQMFLNVVKLFIQGLLAFYALTEKLVMIELSRQILNTFCQRSILVFIFQTNKQNINLCNERRLVVLLMSFS